MKAISDLAAADAASAKAVAGQAEADRAKDLAAANRLENQASHPDPGLYPRASDRVGYGQAMRAQAQGLRDKLANAKANADARAKTAADAAKAYQDCLDRMKACAPKETTPPVQTPADSTGVTTATPGGRRASDTWVVCKDGTTTEAVIPSPPIADVMKKNWDVSKGVPLVNTWQAQDNWAYVLGAHQFKAGIKWSYYNSKAPDPFSIRFDRELPKDSAIIDRYNFNRNANLFYIPNPNPTYLGSPTYGLPSCEQNGQGGVTIGQYYGGFEPRVGFRYTATGPNNPAPGLGVINPLPLDGNFTFPIVPGIFPPAPVITPDTNPPANVDTGLRIGVPRLYISHPLIHYIRPQQYYDYRSQYFWFYDLFGIPHYCAFDFPDALRDFPEIKHALVVEEASRRRRDRSPTSERTDARMQLAAFRTTSPFSTSLGYVAPASQNNAPTAQTEGSGFTYSIVSNGKSTGEAFQLQLLDPTGQVKSVHMRSGAVLEAIAPGVTQPVAATAAGSKVVTQPMNGYCLEFGKHPPAEGTLYRLADESTQQKYRPMRFISRAAEQMEQKKAFHPDSDPKAYMDAIVQYALWSKLEGWSQEQFTQHFVERTKENADALHVKWTKEMENALRAAAPGRWIDISEMIHEGSDLEKNSGQGRGGRRGGRGGGRGGRRGTGN